MLFPYSLTLASSFLRSQILSWYCSSLFRFFRCFACSFLIFSKLSFSSSNVFSYCFSDRSCSYLVIKFLLLQIFQSCLLTLYILFFISVIYSCCLRSSPFFSLSVLSSSLGLIAPYFLFLDRSFQSISSSCCDNQNICYFSLIFCSIIFYFQDGSSAIIYSCSSISNGSVQWLGWCDLAFLYLLQLDARSSWLTLLFSFYCVFLIDYNITNNTFERITQFIDIATLLQIITIKCQYNGINERVQLLFYCNYLGIMFNKINQKGQRPSSRGILNISFKAKSKLTVFMVYKMIQKRKEMECSSKNPPAVFDHLISENIFMRDSFVQTETAKKYRQTVKSQNHREQLVQSATYRKNNRCHTELQSNKQINYSNKVIRRANNINTVQNQAESSQINRQIIQKLKKVVNGNTQDKKKDRFLKLEDFGLNITQIKRLEVPAKRDTIKQRPNLHKINDSQSHEINTINNRRIIHAKRSLLKEKQSKQIIICQQKQLVNVKFQSLDHLNLYKNISGKKIGKQSNNYVYKLHKMFDCLDIILNSYHCFLALSNEAPKNDDKQDLFMLSEQGKGKTRAVNNKYYFYVGNGNNCNLIRSVLRKRGWWTQTNIISKANLVWTQLKIPDIIEKQKIFEENWSNNFSPYEQEEVELKQQVSFLRTSCKKSTTTAYTESPKIKESSFAQIFHEKQDKRYYLSLNPKQSETRLQKIQTPQLIHNHYEQNFMFGNKNALYYNLSMYYDFIKKDLSTIVPLTYYLEKSNPKSLQQFQKAYADSRKKSIIWIVKPAQNSNRGQGIIVTSSLNEIKTALNLHKKVMVQSYIKNLLLYNGRKFDIRAYMIATTINGRLKVFWYDQGYIRTSSQYYDITNLFDSYIHLTNDAIQKTGQNYGKYEEGNKLSYSEFQRYLQNKFGKQNVHINELHEQMKELARDAVKSIYCRIQNSKKGFNFELFGLDFIIDSNFKPLLIEINTNPCLQLSSPILERLIPRMVENMFRLSIDPIFRPKIEYIYTKSESYYIYDQSFLDRNKFMLIFDEKYDRNFEWQQKCKKMRGIEWGEGEQQQYQNEGSLIVVDY